MSKPCDETEIALERLYRLHLSPSDLKSLVEAYKWGNVKHKIDYINKNIASKMLFKGNIAPLREFVSASNVIMRDINISASEGITSTQDSRPSWWKVGQTSQCFDLFGQEWSQKIINKKQAKNPRWDPKYNPAWVREMVFSELQELREANTPQDAVDALIDACIYPLDAAARHYLSSPGDTIDFAAIEDHATVKFLMAPLGRSVVASPIVHRYYVAEMLESHYDALMAGGDYRNLIVFALYILRNIAEMTDDVSTEKMFEVIHRANVTGKLAEKDFPECYHHLRVGDVEEAVDVDGDQSKIGKRAAFKGPEHKLLCILASGGYIGAFDFDANELD